MDVTTHLHNPHEWPDYDGMKETILTQHAEIERLKSQRDRLVDELDSLNEFYLSILETERTSASDNPDEDSDYVRVKLLIAEIEAEND